MKKAFTLVEIMIVVAIIAVLAAVAIPSLLRARINTNENLAIGSLKTVLTASQMYRATNPAYPANLTILGSALPPYVDSTLSSCRKQGYNFGLVGTQYTFKAYAVPQTKGQTGNRAFVITEQGVIADCSEAYATEMDGDCVTDLACGMGEGHTGEWASACLQCHQF